MQSTTTKINEKDIVNIARNVMKFPGWKCEWGSTLTSGSDCRVVLVSWNAYLQVKYQLLGYFLSFKLWNM